MKTVFENTDGEYPILMEVTPRTKKFRVTYGLQVSENLDYTQAALELGSSIMHEAALRGRLDP